MEKNEFLNLLSEIMSDKEISNPIVPSGTLIAYAGEIIPNGWLRCDGQLVAKYEYPSLFNAIGTLWGGNGIEYFQLPDLRGAFIRGAIDTEKYDKDKADINELSKVDPDFKNRKESLYSSNLKNGLGSYQLDELQSHSHIYGKWNGKSGSDYRTHEYGAGESSTSSYGGKETRPKNAYVNWLIKV